VTYADGEGTERYAYAMVPADAPGVVVHDDWDALGMRASGSNSVSFEGVELPEPGVRGGFRTGDPLPYMERNLVAGLFHAAASLGIAESAHAIARDGIAGRINGDARPRMQLAENAIDLAAARGLLSRPAALVDEHRADNVAPARDARSFRDALARFATGVAFITAAPDGEPAGLIVNSLTSVSLEPPLVSFCPSRSSLTWSRMRQTKRFAVNVLGRQHEH